MLLASVSGAGDHDLLLALEQAVPQLELGLFHESAFVQGCDGLIE